MLAYPLLFQRMDIAYIAYIYIAGIGYKVSSLAQINLKKRKKNE